MISDALGFADDTTLRRSFKRVAGMTPGQYRQQFG
ncbi:MAG: AraC family transcriptional regulator [Pseudomonadales bacterium]|nr:AraC family transcriptional regulator [Pseudomonadales bacterium]